MSTWSFLSVVHLLHVREDKKICTKLLIVYVYFQPNSWNTHADREWAQGTFLRQWRKVPPAHAPVRRPSPLNTYSYVREENSGSTRKFVDNH